MKPPHKTTPTYLLKSVKFGTRWKALTSQEDDWADECKSNATAFATTASSE